MINWFEHQYPYTNFHELNLDWILEEVRKCINIVDSWVETARELEQALQDITSIKNRLTNVENLANQLRTELTEVEILTKSHTVQIDELYTRYNELKIKVDNFNNEFNNVYSYINTQISKVERDTDIKISNALVNIYMPLTELQNKVNYLENVINNINTSVVNPWHYQLGKISLNRNINLIYNDLADECLTASQYCKLDLTANNYSDFDITARDYSEFGKDKLHFKWVYSPAYGFKQELNNVLTSIINFYSNTLSSDEYSALDLSADDYSTLDLSASDYYSFSV